MATKKYHKVLTTDSSTYAFTAATGDLTGYASSITIASNTDCTAKIQYSTNGTDWFDAQGYTGLDVNAETYPVTVRLSKYLRVGVVNDIGGEVDSVTVVFNCVSESPTYCDATDVARLMQSYNSVTSGRLVFSASTFPTLAEVNDLILEMEDFIDEVTNHAWRSRLVEDELHNYAPPLNASRFSRIRDLQGIKLAHRSIRQVVSGSHEFEVFNGSTWVDYIASYTEGRDRDYWLDYSGGVFYFGNQAPNRVDNQLRATYEYGEETVPHDIRLACALLVAERLLLTSDYHTSAPDGIDEGRNVRLKSEKFYDRAMQILNERKEFIGVIES